LSSSLLVSRRGAEGAEIAEGAARTTIDDISAVVIDEAIAVHRRLGPGLFETVYETVLAGQLEARGLKVARQVPMPLEVDGHSFEDRSAGRGPPHSGNQGDRPAEQGAR
jgi:hypothetical protein